MARIKVGDQVFNESNAVKSYEKRREVASQDDTLYQEFLREAEGMELETAAPREDEGLGNQAMNALETYVAEPLGAVGHGVLKAFQETGNLGLEASNSINQWLVDNDMEGLAGDPNRPLMTFADNPELVYQPKGTAQGLISGTANFLAPMGALNKAGKGIKATSKLAKFAKSGALGAMADFAAFDPDEKRLSDFVESNAAFSNWMTQYLASNPKDSRFEGRMKNALEGIVLGMGVEGVMGLADSVFKGAKAYRARRVADSTKTDADNVIKKLDDEGIAPPDESLQVEEGQPNPKEEYAKKVQEKKAEVKAERPTQQAVDEDLLDVGEKVSLEDGTELRASEAVDPKQMVFFAKGKFPRFEKMVDKAKRGVLTVKETRKLALDIGENPETFTERLLGNTENAENILAGAYTMKARVDELVKFAELDNAGKLTDVQKVQYMDLLDEAQLLNIGFEGNAAEIGRALNIMKEARKTMGGAGKSRRIQQVLKRGGSMRQVTKGILAASKGGKPMQDIIKRSLGRRIKDAFFESYVNGLLSGVKTQAMNATSNGITSAFSVVERGIAEGSSRVANRISGTKSLGSGSIDSVAAGETWAMANGMIGSLGDAFRLAQENFQTGKSFMDNADKIELRKDKGFNAISPEAFGIDKKSSHGIVLDFLGKTLNLPTRGLGAADEFFKAVNYRAEVYAQAHRKSQLKKMSEGLTDAETEALFKELTDNPDKSIMIEAQDNAKTNTFTKDLDDVEITGVDPKAMDEFIKNTPILKVVAPFTKTSLNLVEYALDRSPFAKNLMADIKAGGATRDTAVARVMLGGSILTYGAYQTANGRMTGRGPTDLKERRALEAGGWKPYSFKMGDKYVEYKKLEPWGTLLSVAADFAEISSSLSSERDVEAQQLLIQGGAVIANAYTPEFLTRNINDFMDILNGDERKLENFVGGLARGSIPYSSALRDVRKYVTDPIQRERMADKNSEFPILDRMLNEMRDTIPGLSDSLPPKRDMFGEAKTFRPLLDNPDDDTPVIEDINDPVKKELRRLNDMAGDNNHIKLDMPEKYMRKSIGGESVSVKFTPEEYDKYVQLSAGIGLESQPFPGMTLKEALNEQITNGYPALDGAPVNDETKILVIKEIVSAYRKSARQQLLHESEKLEERFIQGFEKRSQELSGNGFGGSL